MGREEDAEATKSRSQGRGTDSLELPRATTGRTRGEETCIDESSLAGTTLKAYWAILSRRPHSVGFRDIQRELGFSSPSSALYQMEKLIKLGLVNKDATGDYTVRKVAKVGFLSSFSFIGKHSIPKNAIYGYLTLLINSICLAVLVIARLPPIVYPTLLPGVLSSVIFFYEASKAWKYKRKVFETRDN